MYDSKAALKMDAKLDCDVDGEGAAGEVDMMDRGQWRGVSISRRRSLASCVLLDTVTTLSFCMANFLSKLQKPFSSLYKLVLAKKFDFFFFIQ